MGSHGTHTHWGMVINNYDETDLALLELAYPDHIRKLVYTKEVGKEGTPHIQAFIKMKRDCRLSHMKKLFPRGHFNYLDTAEYRLNAEKYAQKQDDTAQGPSVITNGDPLHTIEGIIRSVVQVMVRDYEDTVELHDARQAAESAMVREDYTMAKVFVSATYKAMWKQFGHDMYENLIHTHTHTHTRTPTKSFVDVGVQTDDGRSEFHCDGQSGDEEASTCSQGDGTGGDSETEGSEGSEESDCSF